MINPKVYILTGESGHKVTFYIGDDNVLFVKTKHNRIVSYWHMNGDNLEIVRGHWKRFIKENNYTYNPKYQYIFNGTFEFFPSFVDYVKERAKNHDFFHNFVIKEEK